jgi:hypothetical protein
MSIVVRYNPPGLTAAKYDQGVSAINEALGDSAPDGLAFHVCFGTDGNLLVSEIWDSREQFEAFGERMMPLLAGVGIDPGRIDVHEVHAIQSREAATA